MLPDGWLTGPEAEELARAAQDRNVLELGAWKGRSTTVLARVARYVVSVDRHQGIAEIGGGDSLPDYLDNVRAFPNVAIVIASFEDFVPLLGDRFDLVYIDGNHTEEAVAHDTALAVQHVREKIAFHDWDFESVRRGAAHVLQGEPDTLVGSLAIYKVQS